MYHKKWAEKERKGSQCAINCVTAFDNTKMFDKQISTVSRGGFFQHKSVAKSEPFLSQMDLETVIYTN